MFFRDVLLYSKLFLLLLIFLAPHASATITDLASEPIQPLKKRAIINKAKVELGRKLFHDPIMSSRGDISCATCHEINKGGADGKKFSIGSKGREGVINAPTVFNSSKLFRQFWDGRADTLHDQIDGPITNPVEMNTKWPNLLARLHGDPAYSKSISALYSDGITRNNIKDLLAEYQSSLIALDSPFDLYLKGNDQAITTSAKKGYELFKQYGCASCHQGENVGGNMFQVFGVVNDYFKKRGNITDADLGRFNVTGNESDKYMFKVPSLRMAKYTAPYLHDGTQKTLMDAVDAMFKFQLGRTAPTQDKVYIVEFIKSLAGKHPELEGNE